jgi:hypothetical protein
VSKIGVVVGRQGIFYSFFDLSGNGSRKLLFDWKKNDYFVSQKTNEKTTEYC